MIQTSQKKRKNKTDKTFIEIVLALTELFLYSLGRDETDIIGYYSV